MVKSGPVYQEGKQVKPVRLAVIVVFLKFMALVLSWTGLGLVLVSVFGLVFVYIPLGVAEAKYEFSKTQVAALIRNVQLEGVEQKLQAERQKDALLGKPLEADAANWEIPDKNYSINIPKIFAISKVIGNVDAADAGQYLPALKKGVAEAAGLSHPGEIGTTFLFAHSVGSRLDFARYNAVFYLLDKVSLGDDIEVVYKGKLFKYSVVSREILSADDTRYLVPQKLSEKLVLQTCYPPGTTWKRLVVVATRVSVAK